MADILNTGVSGLLAFQRALDTTSHNIANASTPGYSRQITDLSPRAPNQLGGQWVGNGVDVTAIRRVFDQTLAQQVRTAGSSMQQLDTFATYADRLDKLFSDPGTGLAASLQQYSDAIQTLATTPSSITARQLLLSQSQSLVSRFKGFQSTLDSLAGQAGAQLRTETSTINSLAQSIATLNQQIVAAHGSGLQQPNDLLDQRDALLTQLSNHVAITTVTEDNGATSVYLGSGQALVANTSTASLGLVSSTADPTEQRLVLRSDAGATDITDLVAGGTVGGLLQLQRGLLVPAQNALGQVAMTIATLANQQQQAGLDLNGQLGKPMFTIPPVTAIPASGNGGSASAAVTRADLGAVTSYDYDLRYDGTGWSLARHDNGAAIPLGGSGTVADPFVADGLSIVVSGTPQAGDSLLVRPTHDVIAGLAASLGSPTEIAAAAPLLTAAAAGNAGSGSIDPGTVANPTAWVRGSYTLDFITAGSWQIRDAGNAVVASGSYTPGAPITFNGMRVAVSGTPSAGDSFSIADNVNGSGDGRNLLALSDLLNGKLLNGGTMSVQDAVNGLVGDIGVQSAQAQAGRDAQSAVLNDASSALDSASGVNLDEEAANLLRYQQAYQAAARIISAAQEMFQTLIDATK